MDIDKRSVSDKDKEVTVTVIATARSDNPDYQPERAELWVNDHRLFNWDKVGSWARDGNRYSLEVKVPVEKLRRGRNVITFQTYNHAGGRADIPSVIECQRPDAQPRGFIMGVAVDNYSNAKVPANQRGMLQDLLGATNDVKGFGAIWQRQDKLYQGKPVVLERLNNKAKRADILEALDELATKVGPDDNCVILLAGHGMFLPPKPAKNNNDKPPARFVFCGPDFDLNNPTETGISSELLYEKLAAIAGHKVVILDACHSGDAAINPVHGLVPGGQGPVIMAACDRHQVSFEFPKDDKDGRRHGLFTYAILEALGEKFQEADTNKDGALDAAEIYWYTRKRMPELLKQIKQSEDKQVPILFAPAEKMVPLAKLPAK
jgi:uncharacterized caspase-like protein